MRGLRFYFNSDIDVKTLYAKSIKRSEDETVAIQEISPNFLFKGSVIIEADFALRYSTNIFYDSLSKSYIARESGYVQYASGKLILFPFIHVNTSKTKAQVVVPSSECLREVKSSDLANLKAEIKKSDLAIKDFEHKFKVITNLYLGAGGTHMLIQGVEPVAPMCGRIMLHPDKIDGQDLSYQLEDVFLSYERIKFAKNIYKDEEVGIYTAPVEKEDGIDIYGQEIFVKTTYTENQFLGYGEGIRIDPTTQTVYAAVEGLLKFNFDNVPTICKTQVFYRDLNEYVMADGDVCVEGSVLSNAFVIAKGNVRVLGNIEGAKVIAKGEIIVEGGVINNSYLKAGRGVEFQFASNIFLLTEGSVKVRKYILNSIVHAIGYLRVHDPEKGRITGGEIRVGGDVEAAVGGSLGGQATYVEVLKFPQRNLIKVQIKDIEEQKEFMDGQIEKLKMIYGARYIEGKEAVNGLSEKRAQKLTLAKKQFLGLQAQLIELEKKRLQMLEEVRKPVEEKDEELARKSNFSVKFKKCIHVGLKVTIRRQGIIVELQRNGTEFYFDKKRSQIVQRLT